MLIAVIIFLFLAFIAIAAVSARMAMRIYCPACNAESGDENPVIPIGGPLLWWCPECDSIFGYREAQRGLQYEAEEAEQLNRIQQRPALGYQQEEQYEDEPYEYEIERQPSAQPSHLDDEFGGF